MRKIIAFALTIGLCACASTQPPPKVLIRTDGRIVTGNPALEQQETLDKTVCNGEAQKASLSAGTNYYGSLLVHSIEEGRRDQAASGVFEGCMASKGYVLANAADAQSVSDSLAATVRERQKLASPTSSAVSGK
jgi:hypothetical protein